MLNPTRHRTPHEPLSDYLDGWRPPQEEWMGHALCRGVGHEPFFPEERGESPREAKELCARCPVRLFCLEYALDRGELGVWGGTTERERRDLRKTQDREKA